MRLLELVILVGLVVLGCGKNQSAPAPATTQTGPVFKNATCRAANLSLDGVEVKYPYTVKVDFSKSTVTLIPIDKVLPGSFYTKGSFGSKTKDANNLITLKGAVNNDLIDMTYTIGGSGDLRFTVKDGYPPGVAASEPWALTNCKEE